MFAKKVLLVILDGWGIGQKDNSNPIFKAKTPNLDNFFDYFPNSQLKASGASVGLPNGIMGNSEVGHLNLGAGRIVSQDLVKINLAIKDGSLGKNAVLQKAFQQAKRQNRRLHFIGLVSDAGVHSLDTHLYKLCDLAKEAGLKDVFIHALTDGRDTDPHSGLRYVKKLEAYLKKTGIIIATIIGRYYTMDRDRRWERIAVGYKLMVKGQGRRVTNISQGLQDYYQEGVSDEFMKPLVRVDKNEQPIGLIRPNDVVICFNFRTERLREITSALTQKNYKKFGLQTIPLFFYTLTEYDSSFINVRAIFKKESLKNTLGEIIAKSSGKQLRIAETEKYAHVTFFFSGGQEKKFLHEKRILIHSPKVATYDLQPEMSAPLIKQAVIKELSRKQHHFVCLNFANGDMVGHTGIFGAIVKAVEAVDDCLGEIVKVARANGYDVLITADHGNAEVARSQLGVANTAHSLSPVPCLLISDDYREINNGILADVAPTVLKIMGLKAPKEMTGRPLV